MGILLWLIIILTCIQILSQDINMKSFTVIIIVLCFFYSLSAQEDSNKLLLSKDRKSFRIYKTWISLNNESKTLIGVLYEIIDSSILVSNSILREDYFTGRFELSKINLNNINFVKTRVKNSVGKGALIGTIAGFVLGGIIGLISGDDDPEKGWFPLTARGKALLGGFSIKIIS